MQDKCALVFVRTMFRAIKGFLAFSNIHGLRFIPDHKIHWIGRVFWIVCVILCWVASAFLILASWDGFLNYSISFVVDTTYLDRVTNFPAVIVCEIGSKYSEEIADKLFEGELLYGPDILKEIAFYRGVSSCIVMACPKPENEGPCNANYSYIAEVLRHNCSGLIQDCTWNGKPFNCCKHFKLINSELGFCYAINSMHTRTEQKESELNMTSTLKTPLGALTFRYNWMAELYILSPEEVPSLQSPHYTLTSGTVNTYALSVVHIENDADVKRIDQNVRKCRYADENYLSVQNYYSFYGCIVETRKRKQIQLCNCTHHLMPNAGQYCDDKGLICLYKYQPDLAVIKPPWSPKPGLSVSCMPVCSEMEISVVKRDISNLNRAHHGIANIRLANLPTERFLRKVVRETLDLIVSVGGTASLFVGASVLSFVEVVYYFGIRFWTPDISQKT